MSKKKEEKSEIKELKEQLFTRTDKGIASMKESEIKKADKYCEDYKKFIDHSKTEREAVKTAVKLAEKAGFVPFEQDKKYKAGDRIYYVNRHKALALAVIGKKGVKDGVRLAIAHIDSPRIDLKPNPMYEASGLAMFKTHYYGGLKKYQWTALPLSLHGVVIKTDGTKIEINLGEKDDEPCFCITDLLPHLAKEQVQKPMAKVFTGEELNILAGSRPYDNNGESDLVKLNIMSILNKKYGITEEDFLSAELSFVPALKTRDVGFDESMIGGYGHDDRVCAYPALTAILETEMPENTVITMLADKEETGSDGNTGMQSDFLRYFIYDLAKAEGEEGYRVLSKSKCLSADVNAAFDPTYASVYETQNCSYLNKGVVISKYMGHGGKYDTSDASAEYMGEIRSMLEKNNVSWQTGELGKVDMGGGGTIAKYVANMNVDVIDLGVPVLSMHAPFEIVSKTDVYMAYRAFYCFFN
ncbi:MAG TPA: aminopeptidase [Candidatus Limousia pullorum]|uniref:M18 family aminopeptidase n=1 Tax=Candidatus Limousia pullorum TaxID=2840860 RepID=A0A9D1S7Q6_9FIRM|nr:aminopeptidase [Anaeromassilibacillus sp. An172]OUP78723.1 aminopeptidase [Anaeromassilibacillus sp. An172]HIU49597.1 aminopeptidase [Candidatus Limousia pullorum]